MIRPAAQGDADAAAELYLRARRAAMPAIPPPAHDDHDVRRWFAEVVLPTREAWLAETDRLIGLMVLHGDWLDQLYLDPDWTGRGVGHQLVELAKRRRPQGLQLWTFASNTRAQAFYARKGFVAVERTDGSANEEHAPDIRYVWRPAP